MMSTICIPQKIDKKIGGGLEGPPPNCNMQMRFLEYQNVFTIQINPLQFWSLRNGHSQGKIKTQPRTHTNCTNYECYLIHH